MKVLKFGGTSLANANCFERVLSICRSENANIIVVSAVSGITNMLVEIISKREKDEIEAVKHIIHDMTDIFADIISDAFTNIELIEKCNMVLFDRLDIVLKEISRSNFNADLVLAQGELITSEILNIYFKYSGYDTELIFAGDIIKIGLDGEPREKLIKGLAQKKFKEGRTYLTQGFICENEIKEICTLGRGGSDLTASIIGAAVEADEIQIWTDISGLHNNDPRYVSDTLPVNELSYNEAAELAYFGAKILHPICILPARKNNIPVHLKNTLKPQEAGTVINSDINNIGIKSIAAKDDITIIKIKSARMLMSHGFLKRIFEVFDDFKTSVDVITTSEVAVSLTIDNTWYLNSIVEELSLIGEVEVIKNQTIICIVGEGLISDANSIQKILSALSDIPLQMVSIGGSKINVSIVTDSIYKKMVLNELHERLMKENYVTQY